MLQPDSDIPCDCFFINKGASDQFMNSYLTPKISSFFVENLRNSQLLRSTWMYKCRNDRMSLSGRAIFASNLDILDRKLLRSELIRGS